MATNTNSIAIALLNLLQSPNVMDSNFEQANIVDVIDSLSRSIRFAAKHLGTGDATIPGSTGAISELSVAILRSSERVADAIECLAEAISSGNQ